MFCCLSSVARCNYGYRYERYEKQRPHEGKNTFPQGYVLTKQAAIFCVNIHKRPYSTRRRKEAKTGHTDSVSTFVLSSICVCPLHRHHLMSSRISQTEGGVSAASLARLGTSLTTSEYGNSGFNLSNADPSATPLSNTSVSDTEIRCILVTFRPAVFNGNEETVALVTRTLTTRRSASHC